MFKKMTSSVLALSLMAPSVTIAGTKLEMTDSYQKNLVNLTQRVVNHRSSAMQILTQNREKGNENVDDLENYKTADGKKPIKELQNKRVLLIGGFNDILGNVGTGKTDQMSLYFADQLETLDKVGISARLISVNSAQDVDSGLKTLAEEIESTYKGTYVDTKLGNKKIGLLSKFRHDKQVVVVTHSRAGLDMLQLLLKSDKIKQETGIDVKPMIASWISIQTPYYGTPLADAISDESKKWINDENISQVVQILENYRQKDKAQAVRDAEPVIKSFQEIFRYMRSDIRAQAMQESKDAIAALENEMNILSVGSYQDKNMKFDFAGLLGKFEVLVNQAISTVQNMSVSEALATRKAVLKMVEDLKKSEEPMLEDKLVSLLLTNSARLISLIPGFPDHASYLKIESPNCLLAPTRNWLMDNYGVQNDGFSSYEAQLAVGNKVRVEALDHFETVMGFHALFGGQKITNRLNSPRFRKIGILALILTSLGQTVEPSAK
jgi:hypothetical protein